MQDLLSRLKDQVEDCEFLKQSGMLAENLQAILPLLKEAISALEAVQYPVAWRSKTNKHVFTSYKPRDEDMDWWIPLYELPAPPKGEQEGK